jgi:hypothetical protein
VPSAASGPWPAFGPGGGGVEFGPCTYFQSTLSNACAASTWVKSSPAVSHYHGAAHSRPSAPWTPQVATAGNAGRVYLLKPNFFWSFSSGKQW